MKTGIELIYDERTKQIIKYGAKHDSQHTDQSLSYNAAILASPSLLYYKEDAFVNQINFLVATTDQDWNIPPLNHNGNQFLDNRKLSKARRIEQLKVAGALIAAEIDRLNGTGGVFNHKKLIKNGTEAIENSN